MLNWIQLMVGQAHAETYLPPTASTIAHKVDAVYNFTMWTSIFFFVILMGGTVFFVMKYRRKSSNEKTPHIDGNHFLEFLWSFIPLVLMLGVAAWGWYVWHEARTMPAQADVEVNVYGRQWLWEFEYPNGKKATNDLTVPVGAKVVLTMTSPDVIHSFYIPSFRLKQDVVPGKLSKLWFEANRQGSFQILCTEFCGTAHSKMLAKVNVVSPDMYQKFLLKKEGEGLSLADQGKALYTNKGCNACHSVDGSAMVGPTWKGLWGREEKLVGGATVKADEAYISESILNPMAKLVAGYPPSMPPYQGVVSPEEINAIIEYIKTL